MSSVDSLRGVVASLMVQARADLAELVAFRSVANPEVEPPSECAKAAQWVIDTFTEAGLSDVTASPTPDGSNCVHGNTTVDGLDATETWQGVDYPAETFRADANVLDGVELMGDGSVADLLWARPSATVLGMDVPSVARSSSTSASGCRGVCGAGSTGSRPATRSSARPRVRRSRR